MAGPVIFEVYPAASYGGSGYDLLSQEVGLALGAQPGEARIREFKDAITADRDDAAHAELEPPAKP